MRTGKLNGIYEKKNTLQETGQVSGYITSVREVDETPFMKKYLQESPKSSSN